jgi:uncharacterized protein (TIGR03382 family)
MDPRTSFGRPLPGACSIATICATNGCDEDEIECLMNVWSGSPGTITLTFTFPTAADRVYVEAGSCRVSSLSPMTCMGGVGSKVWIPDPPPAPQDPRTGCASAGDSAGGLFTTVLALGVLVRRRSRGWRRPQ